MSFLDTLIYGYRTALNSSVELTRRSKINFGSGLAAIDNPTTGATDVTASGGGSSSVGAANAVQTSDGAGAFLDSGWQATAAYLRTGSVFPAASGNVRLAHADTINGRNVLDTADITGIAFEAPNYVSLGGRFRVSPSSIEAAKPIVGDSAQSSPYGMHGGVIVSPALDAAYVLIASEYRYDWLEVTTGAWVTGPYVIELPLPSSKANGYYKTIINSTAFTITISAGFGATTTIGSGATKRIWVDDGGVYDAMLVVSSVSGTAPIVSSGGTTPAISITAATGVAAGSMSAVDKAKLDALPGSITLLTLASGRIYPLDANHLHAWELTDASGNFADTGSTAAPVSLVATTAGNAPVYQNVGIVGKTAVFGVSATGTDVVSNASALASAFSDLPLTNWTLEIWFRSLKPIPGSIMGMDNVGSSNAMVERGASEGQGASVRTSIGGFVNMTTNTGNVSLVNPGVWHHIALVYDTTNSLQRLYVDGQQFLQAAQSGNTLWSSGTTPRFWVAGSQNAAGKFNGQLARCRLSNIARAASYMQDVYQRGAGF